MTTSMTHEERQLCFYAKQGLRNVLNAWSGTSHEDKVAAIHEAIVAFDHVPLPDDLVEHTNDQRKPFDGDAQAYVRSSFLAFLDAEDATLVDLVAEANRAGWREFLDTLGDATLGPVDRAKDIRGINDEMGAAGARAVIVALRECIGGRT